ncbi:hypothetical protein HDV57DRAFT_300085 [Trichoderma longibrachiatum]
MRLERCSAVHPLGHSALNASCSRPRALNPVPSLLGPRHDRGNSFGPTPSVRVPPAVQDGLTLTLPCLALLASFTLTVTPFSFSSLLLFSILSPSPLVSILLAFLSFFLSRPLLSLTSPKLLGTSSPLSRLRYIRHSFLSLLYLPFLCRDRPFDDLSWFIHTHSFFSTVLRYHHCNSYNPS